MKIIDKFFFNLFLKKGKINLIKNKFIYNFFFKLIRRLLIGPYLVQIDGFKLFTYPKKNEPTSGILKRLKFHEASELDFLNKEMSKNLITFIDAGANYGHFSLFVAQKNPKNVVVSFEPMNSIRAQFLRNIEINNFKNIKLEKYAISDLNNFQSFYESKVSWESSFFKNHLLNSSETKVQCVSLDKYFQNYKFITDRLIIKMDIEGFEINALYGAKNILKKNKPIIIFEFSKMLVDNPLYNFQNFKSFLIEIEYQIYNFEIKEQKLEDLQKKLTQLKSNQQTIGNYLLINKNYFS